MSIRSDEQEIQQMIDGMLVKTEQSVTRAYIGAADAVQAKINALYAKYAKDGVLTYAEMQKAKRFDYLMNSIQQIIKDTNKEVVPLIYNNSAYSYETDYYGMFWSILPYAVGSAALVYLTKNRAKKVVNAEVAGMTFEQRMNENMFSQYTKYRDVLTRGFLEGWPINRMAKAIDETTGIGLNSALRIARTETTRTAGIGRTDAYDELEAQGVEIVRVWLATHDMRTRDSHAHLDNTIADGEGYFYIGSDRAKAPGGFSLAKNSANCRCRIIAKLLEYEDQYPKYKSYKDYAKENNLDIRSV